MGKLQSLIYNKAQSAKFMCDEIAHIYNDMPKRDHGSEGEKMACEYMADYLKRDCGCERSTKISCILYDIFFIKVFSDNKKPLT